MATIQHAVVEFHKAHPDIPGTLVQEAVAMVQSRQVRYTDEDGGIWHIASMPPATIENGVCDCTADFLDDGTWCVHQIAVHLVEMTREMDQLQDAPPPTPLQAQVLLPAEAHSITVKAYNRHGFEFLICVRHTAIPAMLEGMEQIMEQAAKRRWMSPAQFERYGRLHVPVPVWMPKVSEPDSTPVHMQTPPQGEQRATVPAPQPEPPRPQGTSGARIFHPTSIVWNVMDGKYLFALKGEDIPRYNVKFGMRIWPETLMEAGFDVETIKKQPSTPLAGYVAEYVLKEGTDKPDKVTRLYKA